MFGSGRRWRRWPITVGLAQATIEEPVPKAGAEWMNRQQVAAYLSVSITQLNRLGLPRTLLGRSPRYSRTVLDEYMKRSSWTPQVGRNLVRYKPTYSTALGSVFPRGPMWFIKLPHPSLDKPKRGSSGIRIEGENGSRKWEASKKEAIKVKDRWRKELDAEKAKSGDAIVVDERHPDQGGRPKPKKPSSGPSDRAAEA